MPQSVSVSEYLRVLALPTTASYFSANCALINRPTYHLLYKGERTGNKGTSPFDIARSYVRSNINITAKSGAAYNEKSRHCAYNISNLAGDTSYHFYANSISPLFADNGLSLSDFSWEVVTVYKFCFRSMLSGEWKEYGTVKQMVGAMIDDTNRHVAYNARYSSKWSRDEAVSKVNPHGVHITEKNGLVCMSESWWQDVCTLG